jgi:hypothetical protein
MTKKMKRAADTRPRKPQVKSEGAKSNQPGYNAVSGPSSSSRRPISIDSDDGGDEDVDVHDVLLGSYQDNDPDDYTDSKNAIRVALSKLDAEVGSSSSDTSAGDSSLP